MMLISRVVLLVALTGLTIALPLPEPVGAQTVAGPGDYRPIGRRSVDAQAIEKLNAWTVGLAGGLLEGAPIRFATEIARTVDDGENLHVLPIVTRGPAEN